MAFRSISVQSSPFRIGVQRVSLLSRARISAGVSGVSPAARTASGNLAAEAGARQHRGRLWGGAGGTGGQVGEQRGREGKEKARREEKEDQGRNKEKEAFGTMTLLRKPLSFVGAPTQPPPVTVAVPRIYHTPSSGTTVFGAQFHTALSCSVKPFVQTLVSCAWRRGGPLKARVSQ